MCIRDRCTMKHQDQWIFICFSWRDCCTWPSEQERLHTGKHLVSHKATMIRFNPKILIWFIAIYSQFMSLNNDIYLNLCLILIASIVDALWYILLVNLVTLKGVHDQIKSKLQFIRKIIGFLFLLISITLIIDLIKWKFSNF